MSLNRCAACGSPNVVTDTAKEGYDYVKGAIGTVVLGVGGAVAGINGKEQTVYKCPDCGVTLTYTMPDEMRQIIDMGEQSEEARKNATIQGVAVSWDVLTAKYKNIKTNSAGNSKNGSAVDELKKIFMFDYSSDEGRALLEVARPQYEDAKAAFVSEAKENEQKKNKAKSDELLTLGEHKKELEAEVKKLNSELSTLGLFKGARKRELREEIEKLSAELSECTKRGQSLLQELSNPNNGDYDEIAKYYAALKAIGHEAVPKQVMQALRFYERQMSCTEIQAMTKLRLMQSNGYLTSNDSFLEYPNGRAYNCK